MSKHRGSGFKDGWEPLCKFLPMTEGIPLDIGLEELVIPSGKEDDLFQRHAISETSVERLARNWSPIAAGVIICAKVPPGIIVVLDGGHRVRAAKRRLMSKLKCLVFELESMRLAAIAFLLINEWRSSLSPAERFKAALAAGDLTALEMKKTFDTIGRTAGTATDGTQIGAITQIRRAFLENNVAATAVLCVLGEECRGQIIESLLFRALFFIECRLQARKRGESLLTNYRDHVRAAGGGAILAEIKREHLRVGRGGSKPAKLISAEGALNAVNAGQKQKIIIEIPEWSRRAQRGHETRRFRKVEILSQVGRPPNNPEDRPGA